MKSNYIKPTIEVVEINTENSVLVASARFDIEEEYLNGDEEIG